ncbi:unnamed protein product [Durusdinium trenchii]|uniref:Uncharacterized protein n=1 Tax=Durusdinium trenchii TaxID=1381693 RepID=A0ABP0QZK5_9DINO
MQAPKDVGGFFPRHHFSSLVLPGCGATGGPLLFLGGQKASGGWCCNDVWRCTLSKTAWRDCNWKLISAHDEGYSDDRGRRWHRKWKPRCNFAVAGASARRGYLLYVAGGEDAAGGRLNDLWASQDGGLSWRCMSQASPWSPRAACALLSVSGRPERLLLCGGLAAAAEVCQDLWMSDDAGFSWHRLPEPSWAHITGRFRAALMPLEVGQHRGDGAVPILILGGCFIDGGEGGGFGGYERLMHDAWEGHVDFETQAVHWKPWGTQMDERGRRWARLGMDVASCTKERDSHLVALLPGHPSVSVAPLCAPENAESLPWRPAQEPHLLREALRHHWSRSISVQDGYGQCHVRLSTALRAVPRLVLAFDEGILISSFEEWQRQVTFLLLVALRQSRRPVAALPVDVWRQRILPAVLPGL